MASAVDIRMTGEKKLIRAFKKLEGKEQKKGARKGLRAAAKPIRNDAVRLAPADEQRRLKRIVVRAIKRSRRFIGIRVMTTDDPTGPDRSVAHKVELGTKNMQAQPFLRPALHKNRANVFRIFGRTLWEHIRRVKA